MCYMMVLSKNWITSKETREQELFEQVVVEEIHKCYTDQFAEFLDGIDRDSPSGPAAGIFIDPDMAFPAAYGLLLDIVFPYKIHLLRAGIRFAQVFDSPCYLVRKDYVFF